MAQIFNEQRVLGIVIVSDGTRLYNNQPVIGVVDAGISLFVGNARTLGVNVLAAATVGISNDQPVIGAVLIGDGRKLYNDQGVVPVTAISGVLA